MIELEQIENIKLVLSPCFDETWYLETYEDVRVSGIDPLHHYISAGEKEGREPTPYFSPSFYLSEYKDVSGSGISPFYHYVVWGYKEGRLPNQHVKSMTLGDISEPTFKYKTIDHFGFDCDTEYHLPKVVSEPIDLNFDENTKLVTFDIWDTILRRDCHPDETKLSAMKYVLVTYYHEIKPGYRHINNLLTMRKNCENRSAPNKDFEYFYGDAVKLFIEEVFTSVSSDERKLEVVDDLLRVEYEIEKYVTRLDAETSKWISKISSDKQQMFISDFYMNGKFLKDLLKDNGLNSNLLEGYSSCDYYKNKRTGSLFKKVIADFELSGKEIFHVGDNKVADYIQAKQNQMQAFHYVNQSEEDRKQWYGEALWKFLDGDLSLHHERIIGLVKNVATKNKLGNTLSLIVIPYVLSVLETALRENVEKIYFFTREGVILKEIYDELVKLDPYFQKSYPNSELLEVSRIATFGASLNSWTNKEFMRMWSMYSTQSPQGFVKSLNLSEVDYYQDAFEQAGLAFTKPIQYPWLNSAFNQVIFSPEFENKAWEDLSKQRERLKSYLTQKGLFDEEHTLIVDIGWRGTIQDNIAQIVKGHVRGAYLGLFSYINEQPKNTEKYGFLFNENIGALSNISEVAPLEMLFNSLGGSTIGYSDEGQAERYIIEGEESVIRDTVSDLQASMLTCLSEVVSYMKKHALTANELVELSRVIVKELHDNSPKDFADAFFKLEHNETFGTGSVDVMDKQGEGESKTYSIGSDVHAEFSSKLSSIRWKQGYVKQSSPKLLNEVARLPWEYQQHIPSELVFSDRLEKIKGKRVGFYIPSPLVGSGGHRTMMNVARKFYQCGFEVFVFMEHIGAGIDVVKGYLQEAKAHIFESWHSNIPLDIAFATIAHSAKYVSELPSATHKCYLVQDFEAMFNPVGDGYHIAEQSFIYGLNNFTIGNWLTDVTFKQFGQRSTPSGLGIDTDIYYVDESIEKEDAVCLLYQPEKFRRCPNLAIGALKKLKEANPSVTIYVYGSDAPLVNVDFEVVNLGLIHDLNELRKLYNKCKVGLCISMTNPSRIPYEMMASGCVPVDIYRYNNLLDFKSGTSLLAYQSHDSLCEAMARLIVDQEFYDERKEKCISFASTRSLDWENSVIVNNCINLVLKGNEGSKSQLSLMYNDDAIISKLDNTNSVLAFLEYQKSIAK
ncbi:TPA: hypothetical protein NJ298_002662 [Vibrio parahaemolyticus]|nr:hypothetical protein [Vibrio parahaemolyticus]